jgi:hypothetical protein
LKILLLVTALLFTACNAEAQTVPTCAPYETVIASLASSYHEFPIASAIGGQGTARMIIFASADGSTWTAVSVRPKDKLTCIIAAGTDFFIDPNYYGKGL